MHIRASLLLLGVVVLFVLSIHVEAQTWRVYTASDKSFSVEVPWKPFTSRRNTAGMLGGPGGAITFRGTSAVDIYNLAMYSEELHTSFVISVYHLAERDTEKEFDAESKLAPKSTLGKQQPFGNETDVVVNGLRGREYVYQNGKVASRLLIVFAEHRIYTVAFYTEDKKGLSRAPVDKVFTTFQPLP